MDLQQYWNDSAEALQAWGGRLDGARGSQGTARDNPEPSIYERTGFDTARLRGAYAPKYRPSVRALSGPAARPSMYRKIYDAPIGPIVPVAVAFEPAAAEIDDPISEFEAFPTPEFPAQFSAQSRALTMKDILVTVSQHYGVAPGVIKGPGRAGRVVKIRHLAMWLTWGLTFRSSTEIAMFYGGRDHSTCLHAFTKMCAAFGIPYERNNHAADVCRLVLDAIEQDNATGSRRFQMPRVK